MAITISITLSSIRVNAFRVLFNPLRITVLYDVLTSTGAVWKSGERTFWQTLPPNPDPSWSQLPPAYAGQLNTMLSSAVTAIENAELT